MEQNELNCCNKDRKAQNVLCTMQNTDTWYLDSVMVVGEIKNNQAD